MIPTEKTPIGGFVLKIAELQALSSSQRLYFKNTKDKTLRRQLFVDLKSFLQFCINYSNSVFKGKEYNYDHVAPHLFVTKFKSNGQYKSYLRHSLYVSKFYAEVLLKDLKLKDIENCEELILNLMADYEWLLLEYENVVLGNSATMVCHGSRRSMNPLDLKFGANQLMFLEQTGSLKRVDYRNTKPVVMFVVRQCLEVLGKNIIGFDEIVDAGGKPIHQFTQIAWTFLHEMEKQGKNLVTLPLKAVSIHTLNSWTNSYVHDPFIYANYIQYYALKMLWEFSKPPRKPVDTYDGKSRIATTFGDFLVPSYNNMKVEFEAYLHQIRPNLTFRVIWLKPEEVGAYIKAL